MALIVCPDCGNQVSEKAERCPACGCPKSAIIAYKEEEQAILEEAKQKQKKDKRNRILKFVIPITVCLIAIIAVLAFLNRQDASGLYHHFAWGSSIETVKEKLPEGYESTKKRLR